MNCGCIECRDAVRAGYCSVVVVAIALLSFVPAGVAAREAIAVPAIRLRADG